MTTENILEQMSKNSQRSGLRQISIPRPASQKRMMTMLSSAVTRTVQRTGARILCTLFGHLLSHSQICECGASILHTDGTETRIRHVVGCFISGHQYVYCTTRNGHDEYTCTQCGHPLLFRVDSNPYQQVLGFRKKVRYLCNLFGHSVHTVGFRNDFVEYACDCGHSFLKNEAGRTKIKHPPVCLFAGHFIQTTRQDRNFKEFACRNCGHTFLLGFATGRTPIRAFSTPVE